MAGVFLLCEHAANDKAPPGARGERWTKERAPSPVTPSSRRRSTAAAKPAAPAGATPHAGPTPPEQPPSAASPSDAALLHALDPSPLLRASGWVFASTRNSSGGKRLLATTCR